jgi:hypothetical protein
MQFKGPFREEESDSLKNFLSLEDEKHTKKT